MNVLTKVESVARSEVSVAVLNEVTIGVMTNVGAVEVTVSVVGVGHEMAIERGWIGAAASSTARFVIAGRLWRDRG